MIEQSENSNVVRHEPRERYYVLGHIAFRQIVESDPHYFFGVLSEQTQRQFLENLIVQVEQNCPDDTSIIDINEIEVMLSRVANYPLALIKMPSAKAYMECKYVGVVSILDMNLPIPKEDPQVKYFTLELGKGAEGNCNFFCEWIGEQHCNLAEVQNDCSIEEFATLISHRLESVLNKK